MLPLYIHRDSIVHRLPAGAKVLAVIMGSVVVLSTPNLAYLAMLILAVIAVYAIARLPLAAVFGALRPVLVICGLLFAMQLAFSGLNGAASTTLRVMALVLLTAMVSYTTRLSDMIEALTAALRRLAPLGLNPSKIALAIGLTIRFIPLLLRDIQEVQNARKTRGAAGFGVLGTGPLIIKILRMTDALGNAIAARGFENRS